MTIHSEQNGNCAGATLAWSRECYGVVLSGATLTVVRSRRTAGKIRHTAITPDDASAYGMFLAEARQPDAAVVGVIGVGESLTLWLTAPFTSLRKIQKVMPSLLDVQLPFPLDSCQYYFPQVRRMPNGTSGALAAAARRESVVGLLEKYRAREIDPLVLDHEGLALWTQSVAEIPPQPNAYRVVFFHNADCMTLVIGEGLRYLNAHSLRNASLAGAAVTLAERILRIIRAEVPPGVSIQWTACGDGVKDRALVQDLHRQLAGEWPGTLAFHQEPETFLARAIGVRFLTKGPWRCNLRTGGLVHPAVMRHQRKTALTAAGLMLLAGLVLCGLDLSLRLASAWRFRAANAAVTTCATELAPGARIAYGQEVSEVQKVLDRKAEREAPFLTAFTPSLAIQLAAVVQAGQAARIDFETLSLKPGRLMLTGAADNWDQCESLAEKLKQLGYAVTLERKDTSGENQVRFAVQGERSSK